MQTPKAGIQIAFAPLAMRRAKRGITKGIPFGGCRAAPCSAKACLQKALYPML